jgi:hypothetical protein
MCAESEMMTYTMQILGHLKIIVSVARIESTTRDDFTALVLGKIWVPKIHTQGQIISMA